MRIGHAHLTQAIMSILPSPSTSRSNLDSIFNAALKTYKKKIGKDIASHPLANELQSCDSPDAILAILRRQITTPDQAQSGDETFAKFLIPTVNILYALSNTLGEGVGLVISVMSPPVENLPSNISPRCSRHQKQYLLVLVFFSWSAIFYFRCVARFEVWRF